MRSSPAVVLTGVGRVVRAGALAVVSTRLVRGSSARPTIGAEPSGGVPDVVTVVIPARDEGDRIEPVLRALRDAPGVAEVIVVDDRSSDRTAAIAAAHGATVVTGIDTPSGWSGKPWALAQGVDASTTEWVVCLDADVEPDPTLPVALVRRAERDRLDLVSAAGRFELCDAPARWLHAAMLAQLVYRFGPPGTTRTLANGQCVAARRARLIAWLPAISGAAVEDVALARHVRRVGGRVDFLDAADLLLVRPYRRAGAVWSGWGRSIGLRGIEPGWRQLIEIGVVLGTTVVPVARLLTRRADAVDVVAILVRLGTVAGTRRVYRPGGLPVVLSPLADPFALAALVWGLVDPTPTWRGRTLRS